MRYTYNFILFFIFYFFCTYSYSETTPKYLITDGDILNISVVEHPEFSGRQIVKPDGFISLPVIKEVFANGLSPDSLSKILEFKLCNYVNNPSVNVVIDKYAGKKITVIGNVKEAGEYKIIWKAHLTSVLSMAGGLDNKKLGKVKIFRADSSVQKIDLIKELEHDSFVKNQNLYVHPGDIVYVQSNPFIDWEQMQITCTALLALIGLFTVLAKGFNFLKNNFQHNKTK